MAAVFSLYVSLRAESEAEARVGSGPCLGPNSAKHALIYLHGLEETQGESEAEKVNRKVLEQLAQKLSVRIAQPQSEYRCAAGKRCWPGSDPVEVLRVYKELLLASQSCWSSRPPDAYALLGFSNGGYFAFKLYKAHSDPKLKRILASGSSGTWEPKTDKINALSRFELMLGLKELTLPAARRFAESFKKSEPKFTLETFEGGHYLDEATLVRLLQKSGF